jgi:hypothetical protein
MFGNFVKGKIEDVHTIQWHKKYKQRSAKPYSENYRKLGKPQWPRLGTDISKEVVG